MSPTLERSLLDACINGDLITVQALLRVPGLDVNCVDPSTQMSPVHLAAAIPDAALPIAEILTALQAAGAKIRNSALHIAGTSKAVKFLVQAKADVTSRTPDGQTALSAAVTAGRDEVALELLRSPGIVVDPALLHKVKNTELLREICARAPDVDFKDPQGKTALQLAVERGDRAAARILLEFKANPSLISNILPSAPTMTAPASPGSALHRVLACLADLEKALVAEGAI